MKEFDEIYREYSPKVFLFLKALTRDELLSEELTAETFYRAIVNINKFRGDCDISVWLCQIAKNLYYSHCRKQKKRSDGVNAEDIVSDTDIEITVADSEQSKEILRLLHELDEPYKEVFMLHVFAEIPLKEVCVIFGKSESWARVTFYRAKTKIMEKLREGENYEK